MAETTTPTSVLKPLSDKYTKSTASPNTITAYTNYSIASGRTILEDVSNIKNYPLSLICSPLIIKDVTKFGSGQLDNTACCTGDIILTDVDSNKFVFKDFEEWDDVSLDYFNEQSSGVLSFNRSPISVYQKNSYIYLVFAIKDVSGIDTSLLKITNNKSGSYAISSSLAPKEIAIFGIKIPTQNYDNLEITVTYDDLSEVIYSGKALQNCGTGWSLVFSDRYGGFPSYPITTKLKESVGLENSQYALPSLTGIDAVVGGGVTRTRKWSFHTGWLNKEISDYLYYSLIQSDYLLLCDPDGNRIRVKITDSDVTKKDFDADGLRYYTINLEELKDE